MRISLTRMTGTASNTARHTGHATYIGCAIVNIISRHGVIIIINIIITINVVITQTA